MAAERKTPDRGARGERRTPTIDEVPKPRPRVPHAQKSVPGSPAPAARVRGAATVVIRASGAGPRWASMHSALPLHRSARSRRNSISRARGERERRWAAPVRQSRESDAGGGARPYGAPRGRTMTERQTAAATRLGGVPPFERWRVRASRLAPLAVCTRSLSPCGSPRWRPRADTASLSTRDPRRRARAPEAPPRSRRRPTRLGPQRQQEPSR